MPIDAGDFEDWLAAALASFRGGAGLDVPCGECRGCCTSGHFVHVTPADGAARAGIPPALLAPAPGAPRGHELVGFDRDGRCALLTPAGCRIYASRPHACRAFDCRVFAAAGLAEEGAWAERINARVREWRFTYRAAAGRARHDAIRRAAAFVAAHAQLFPGGRVPTRPGDLAVLAIEVHELFVDGTAPRDVNTLVAAIVAHRRG